MTNNNKNKTLLDENRLKVKRKKLLKQIKLKTAYDVFLMFLAVQIIVAFIIFWFVPTSYGLDVIPGEKCHGCDTRAAYGAGTDPTIIVVNTTQDNNDALTDGTLADDAGGTVNVKFGSLRRAMTRSYPRVIIFGTSGMMDWSPSQSRNIKVNGSMDYMTVAGQTAGTLGYGLNGVSLNIQDHDILIQHLKIFGENDATGTPTCGTRRNIEIFESSFSDPDTDSVVVDHVTSLWGLDLCGSISFKTSNSSFVNCLFAEGLAVTCHDDVVEGQDAYHSMGIALTGTSSALIKSVIMTNHNRSPEVSISTDDTSFTPRLAILNNLMYSVGNNDGTCTMINNLNQPVYMSIYGNHVIDGPQGGVSHLVTMWDADAWIEAARTGSELYVDENLVNSTNYTDVSTWPRTASSKAQGLVRWAGATTGQADTIEAAVKVTSAPTGTWPTGYSAIDENNVKSHVLTNVGAYPANRDSVTQRLIDELTNETGGVVTNDPPAVPNLAATPVTHVLPANPHTDSGDGYTNLEKWLHQLASQAVTGSEAADCTIDTPASTQNILKDAQVNFTGSCTEPNEFPMTYLWNFDGGATNSTDLNPGNTTFATVGNYSVSFTATSSGGTSTPATVAVNVAGASAGSNYFGDDTACKAVWNLDNGALTTDSKGTNTLTNDGVVADTADFFEGDASGDFDKAETDALYITDQGSDSGMPFRSDKGNGTGTVCAKIKADSSNSSATIFSKGDFSNDHRSITVTLANMVPKVSISDDGGIATQEACTYGSALSTGTWYSIIASYDDPNARVTIYAYTSGSSNLIGTGATCTLGVTDMHLSTSGDYVVGGLINRTTFPWDGHEDEVVVFDDILTLEEAQQYHDGLFGASGPTVAGVTCRTAGGAYGTGESIGNFDVEFSEAVDVTGTPQMTFELGDNDATVSYAGSGSGTTILVFSAFTVSEADSHTSSDLDALTLTLNGGSIASTSNSLSAVLALPTGASAGSLATNSDIVIDTTDPTITDVIGYHVSTCPTCTQDGTYGLGETIEIAITTSESIVSSGDPPIGRITMITGPGRTSFWNYVEGTTNPMRFSQVVSRRMSTSDLNYEATDSLELSEGFLRDAAGNSLVLTLPAPVLATNADIVLDALSAGTSGFHLNLGLGL